MGILSCHCYVVLHVSEGKYLDELLAVFLNAELTSFVNESKLFMSETNLLLLLLLFQGNNKYSVIFFTSIVFRAII